MLKLLQILQDEKGQGQTEYGMLLVLGAIAAIFAVAALGYAAYALWDEIISALPF